MESDLYSRKKTKLKNAPRQIFVSQEDSDSAGNLEFWSGAELLAKARKGTTMFESAGGSGERDVWR